MSEQGWIGVDLDGTLAEYDEWRGADHIGKPIPAMVARVKQWLKEGKAVKIFTARVYDGKERTRWYIEDWCMEYLGTILPVTNLKDYGMVELWDDRAVQVVPNTGEALIDRIAQLEAERDALAAALDSLKADFRLRCVEDGLWLAVEWLDDLDDHGCREILTARDARMKRAGIVELLDDLLMVNMQEPVREDEDPRDALQRLIDWETQISLDPLVSRPAKELERQGAREALRGLPGTTNSDYETDWDAGWDAYCAKVRAAIAALEQEGEGS